jgi:hypothetical protein
MREFENVKILSMYIYIFSHTHTHARTNERMHTHGL